MERLVASVLGRPLIVAALAGVMAFAAVSSLAGSLVDGQWGEAVVGAWLSGWLASSLWRGAEFARDLMVLLMFFGALFVPIGLVMLIVGNGGFSMLGWSPASPVASGAFALACGVASVLVWRSLTRPEVRAYFANSDATAARSTHGVSAAASVDGA